MPVSADNSLYETSNPFRALGWIDVLALAMSLLYAAFLGIIYLWYGGLVELVSGLILVTMLMLFFAFSAWQKWMEWRLSKNAPVDFAPRSMAAKMSTDDARYGEETAYSANDLKELLNKSEITPIAGSPSAIFETFVGHEARAHPTIEALTDRTTKAVLISITTSLLIIVLAAAFLSDPNSVSSSIAFGGALAGGFWLALRPWTFRRLIRPLGSEGIIKKANRLLLLGGFGAAIIAVGTFKDTIDPYLEKFLTIVPAKFGWLDYTLPLAGLLICSVFAGMHCTAIIIGRRGLLNDVVDEQHSSREFSLSIERSASTVLWEMQREIWGQDVSDGKRRIIQTHENLEEKSLEGGRDVSFILAESIPVFRRDLTEKIGGKTLKISAAAIGNLLLILAVIVWANLPSAIMSVNLIQDIWPMIVNELPHLLLSLIALRFSGFFRRLSMTLSSEFLFESSIVRILIKSETNRQLAPTISPNASEVRKESLSDMNIKAEALTLISSTLAGARRGYDCCLSYPRYIIACGSDFELTKRLVSAAHLTPASSPMHPGHPPRPPLIDGSSF